MLCRNFTKNLCRTNGYLLAKLLGLVFLALLSFKFSYVEPENKFIPKLEPLKSVLQIYSLHFRFPAEEHQLESVPLNWVDVKIGTYPRGICENFDKNDNSANMLFVIHSRNNNFKQRSFLRNNYFKADSKTKFSAKHFFVVAVGNASKILIKEVKSEASKHKDILVIENIQDDYHKISFKVRVWVAYLAERCPTKPSIKYIVKMDDDVVIDMPALLHILPIFDSYKNVVLCRTFLNGQLTRNNQSKWYLSKKEYPHNSLGMYCQGMAYLFSSQLLVKMAANLKKVQYLWMDDWYTTHALMNGTGAAYFDIGAHYISTNSRDEADKLLKTTKLRYQPIFGHFRPNYTLEETKKFGQQYRTNLESR